MIDSLFLLVDVVAMIILMRWSTQKDDNNEEQE